MTKGSDRVKLWRKNTKNRMVLSMGGKCQICGYNKCNEVLDFHHLDPNEKDFGFGFSRAHPRSAEIIQEELKKCILLCSNCHREVHLGIANIPDVYAKFDISAYGNGNKEQIGSKWITNGKINKKLKAGEVLPAGFEYGRFL